MSFREKSAWITFLTVLLASGVFFGATAGGELHPYESLHLLIVCMLGVIVLQVVLHVVAAIMNPADARSPKDERERDIELRAHRVGYYVLAAAVLAMGITGHATFDVRIMIYHALAALVLSTLSISLTQIVLFRLGR